MRAVILLVVTLVLAGCQHRCDFPDGSASESHCIGLVIQSSCRPPAKEKG